VDVEVGYAMIPFRLTFPDFVLVISAFLVASFALQHRSNMESLKNLLTVPQFEVLIWLTQVSRFRLSSSVFVKPVVTHMCTAAVEAMLLSQIRLEHFDANFSLSLIQASKALVFCLKIFSTLQENDNTQNDENGKIITKVFICEEFSQRCEFGVSFLLLELRW
jgi:hypothetical protein